MYCSARASSHGPQPDFDHVRCPQSEGQKVEQKQVAAERQVLSKLEKIKLDQEQRAAALERDAQAEELQVRHVSIGS